MKAAGVAKRCFGGGVIGAKLLIMKPLNLLLIAGLLVAGQTNAQPSSYTIFSFGAGRMSVNDPGRDVSSSFSYTATDVSTGVSAFGTFRGSLGQGFLRTVNPIDLADLEFVRGRHSIDLGVGIANEIGTSTSVYFKGGYRKIFSFGGFQIKPALDLYYFSGGSTKMGSIDNRNQDLTMMGFTATSEWTKDVTDEDGNVTETDTYYADHLDVNYTRHDFAVKPSVIVAKQLDRLCLSVEAGWMQELGQSCFLKLDQRDGAGNGNYVGGVPLDNNGSMSGLYFAVGVGVRLGKG